MCGIYARRWAARPRQDGRGDILAALGILHDKRHRHQLPRIKLIKHDVTAQIDVIEPLRIVALDQNRRGLGTAHCYLMGAFGTAQNGARYKLTTADTIASAPGPKAPMHVLKSQAVIR